MDLLSKIAAAKEEAEASSDKLDKIRALVEEGAQLQEIIENLTEALKSAKGRFNRIKQYELVEIMKEANVGKYESLDGKVKTKLDNYVSGSLPKEEFAKEEALGELERAGGGALIKTDISVRFPKNMSNAAKDFFVEMQALLKKYDPANEVDFDPTMNEGVHAASLQAFGRQALKAGENIDFEKLGLTVGTHVKFDFYEEDEKGKLKKKKKVTEDE